MTYYQYLVVIFNSIITFSYTPQTLPAFFPINPACTLVSFFVFV